MTYQHRTYRPDANHPIFRGVVCPYCEHAFTPGDEVVLHPVEDEADANGVTYMRVMDEDEPRTVPAAVMHVACAIALEGQQ